MTANNKGTKKTASPSAKKSSSQETAGKIQSLLKEKSPDERADAARLDELRRIFASLGQSGDLTFSTAASSSSAANSVTRKWNHWLQQHHKQFVAQLVQRIQTQGRRTAVRTLLGVVAASPQQTRGGQPIVHAELLYQWIQSLLEMPLASHVNSSSNHFASDKSIHHMLQAEWTHRDVQYYVLRVLTRWANETYHRLPKQGGEDEKEHDSSSAIQEPADRALQILMMLPFPTSQDEIDQQSQYLFPPPITKHLNSTKKNPQEKERRTEDSDNENDSDDSDDDDDSDDNSSSKSSSDEDDQEEQATKKKPNKQRFAYQDVQSHLTALSKAWMALLRLPLSTASLKRALPFLSQQVLPHLSHPLRFADLFVQAYGTNTSGAVVASPASSPNESEGHVTVTSSGGMNSGGVIPLLALDGLFYLMTQHRLEYPHFYTQLYALIQPSLFYVKYRTRFFALLQKCLLRNDMMPAHIVAAFIKRLTKCALAAPPAGALFVLALVSNLLRQHEECAALIHRGGGGGISSKKDSDDDNNDEQADPYDQYDPTTNDPVQSKALQSSLWELNALECHYHPAVATLAKSIGREDPKSPLLNLDDMASHTYTSLLEQERKRHKPSSSSTSTSFHTKKKKLSSSTAVAFVPPKTLFSQDDVFAGFLKVPYSSS